MIRALIVDDELHAREELEILLADHADFTLAGSCSNAIEALKVINRERPDVVFLDIQMPRISGLELIGMLDPEEMPRIVFVTAFDEYAVAAFEENAFDYLLKPVENGRFEKTLERIRKAGKQRPSLDKLDIPTLSQIPCFVGNRIRLMRLCDVEYVYSDTTGVHVVTGEGEGYTDMTLRVLEQKTDLVPCHRQSLVRLEKISEIRLLSNGLAEMRTESGHTVGVSRRYLREIKERFGLG